MCEIENRDLLDSQSPPPKLKGEKGMSEGAIKAKQRPANYFELSPREQWDIDKALGILDWDGQ